VNNTYLIKLVFEDKDSQLHIGNLINIDLTDVETVINNGLEIIFVIITMYFSIKIGKYLIKKFVERQVKSNAMLSLDPQRAKTLGEVLKSFLKYSVYFIGIGIIVSILFSGISFTFASIGGIAVGLGAQSLIRDLINGFFILFENQFGVGDHVTLGSFNGIVKSIGIRTTVIKDFTGDIHSIPNGSISGVTNHSRNDIKFIVDANISYEEDIEKILEIMKVTCEDFKDKNQEYIDEPIEVSGIKELGVSSIIIRVTGKAKPLSQWKMENELRKAIKLALDKNKAEIISTMAELENENIEKRDKQ
jgi:small-conductance mechanosensitive channel